MRDRGKWLIVAAVAAVALGATTVGAVDAWQRSDAAQAAPAVPGTALPAAEERIVFRSTDRGDGYGHVAEVALADPRGPRVIGEAVCDRLDATAAAMSCLRVERGIVPSASATVYDADGTVQASWPLAGIPSRTRLSPSGALAATTSFVSGHSYAALGFSTQTTLHTSDGTDLGDLEEWTLLQDGQPSAPLDRNYWGITFADDSSFYATVGLSASGTTFLVHGDIATRTLTTLAENVECPSLSPDGTRIAFKRLTAGSGADVHWTPALYDLATGAVTLLPEARSIDDQIAWLDDDTILYGMPRAGAVGDADVWRLATDGSGEPAILIEHAWSPAVVRSGS